MAKVMNPILARFQGEAALIDPHNAARFEMDCAGAATFLEWPEIAATVAAGSFWFDAEDYRATFRPYNVVNGILQVPVRGVMLNGFPWATSWATGYEYIRAAMQRGMADNGVKGIALLIDSPGGMVSGNFDLVDDMHAMRGQKPIKAFAADSAYSAAYSIASAADEIVVTRSGGVGSVGVVTMHVDMSKALDEAGYKITFIHAGKHKVEGNPYEPLPDDVRKRIQARIDATYTEFVGIVARNRGMEEKAVRATEALTYSAQEALDVGFADRIGRVDDEITAFEASSTQQEDDDMAETPKAQTPTITDADVTKARTEGHAAGVTAERARINAVLASDAAKARPKTAAKLALGDKFAALDAETLIEMLAELPEEKAEAPAPKQDAAAGAPKGMFEAAMNGTNPPAVEATEPALKSQEEQDAALIASYGLNGFKSK
jgi:signal peptide peptidase SppA